jgi:hypothetical protein
MSNPVMTALMLARADERLVALKYEEAPRSWDRAAKLAFMHLPPALQAFYCSRERERDRAVRVAQNERAAALKLLAKTEDERDRALAKLKELDVSPQIEGPIAPLKETGTQDVDFENQNTAAA